MTAPEQSRINLTTVLKEFLIYHEKEQFQAFIILLKLANISWENEADILKIHKVSHHIFEEKNKSQS